MINVMMRLATVSAAGKLPNTGISRSTKARAAEAELKKPAKVMPT